MKELISKFYASFNALDAQGMVDCYHDDIVFEDPAFGVLEGEQAKAMWKMLCASQKGKEFKVIASDIEVDHYHGTARWEAFYVFSRTGRRVHNIIDARFRFKNSLIVEHRDDFNLYRWSKEAFGFKGMLLGGTSFFQNKLQAQCHKLLARYQEKELMINSTN